MKTITALFRRFRIVAAFVVPAVFTTSIHAQNLAEGLVSYWPLDTAIGDKTPDLVSGYDLSPYFGPSHTLTNAQALTFVAGHRGAAVSFTNENQILLGYIAGAGDDLPINKHAALTISFWINGAASQNDRRAFSEGNTAINNPLFNIGANSSGGMLDLFLRQQPTASELAAGFGDFGAGSHLLTADDPTKPYDNSWHMVTFVQTEDGSRTVYIDGVADSLAIPQKPAGAWNVNATSIGGILRSTAAAWVTASIDEVAVWKRALNQGEIDEVRTNGLASVFPPLAADLVSHWPLDAVVGGKTPDVVNGYDLSAYSGPSHLLTNENAIHLVTGIRSNAVSFTDVNQVLLGYIAGPSDELPINKHAALTISFWVNAPASQSDKRMFSEGNTALNNPLFNIGANSSGGMLDFFLRQQPTAAELAAGFGDFGAGSHLLTADDPTKPYDGSWHFVVFAQQEDGTRTAYIDGVADSLAIPAKPSGAWNVNATSIGGILRSTAAAWATAIIDDVALWKRALTTDEINDVRLNGVPKTFTRKLPLQIKNFAPDRPTVAQGDTATLSWEASADALLSLAPGIGDVMGRTSFGVGSTSLVLNATTTYTLTASRGGESTNRQATINVVTGIAPGWRFLETFNLLTPGHLGSQGNWQNPLSSVSGALNQANVVDVGNKILGFNGQTVLAATALSSMGIPEGRSNTLFFRLYLSPSIDTAFEDGTIPMVDINFGLTEKGLRDVQDFRGGNNGPTIRLFRNDPAGGPINITANNGVNGTLGTYSFVDDTAHNPSGLGLATGKVYNFWMDIQNRPFDVVGGVQNGGDLYSLYMQKEGDPVRTLLFQDYLSDRDAVAIDPVLGAPGPTLTHLFFCANDQTAPQGTNTVLFDDFFLSANGILATTPVPASSFVPLAERPNITASVYDRAAGSFTLTWTAQAGQTYTVHKRSSLVAGSWTPVVTGYPSGGATGGTVTFTDTAAGGSASFYQISAP
jgi:hypothetical protein